jgi:hypothetical protein
MSTVTITVEQLTELMTAMEERIMTRITKNQTQIKKAFANVDEQFEAIGSKVTTVSSEKPAKVKREVSEGMKAWNELVSTVWAELKEENPKATRQDAMKEASARKDAEDPEGAEKRAAAREKREAAKEKKKSAKSSKASSDSEEDVKPAKKVAKKPAKADTDDEDVKTVKKVAAKVAPKKPAKKEAVESDDE